jgi:flagellar export protein FliJ
MNEHKEKLRRSERLAGIRQSFLTAAEGRVREAEQQLRLREETAAERDRQIRQTQEEIAYLNHASGASIQNRERFIFGLLVRARHAHEALEKARIVLESRRREWREAMREYKVIVKVQERRLQEWRHIVNVADQRHIDEMTVAQHARNQFHHDSAHRRGTGADNCDDLRRNNR